MDLYIILSSCIDSDENSCAVHRHARLLLTASGLGVVATRHCDLLKHLFHGSTSIVLAVVSHNQYWAGYISPPHFPCLPTSSSVRYEAVRPLNFVCNRLGLDILHVLPPRSAVSVASSAAITSSM
jgi:hypothetical protein